jgi:hypothetical protein
MTAPLKATFFALRRRERGGVLTRATLVHALLLLALFISLFAFAYVMRPVTDAGGTAYPETVSGYGFIMLGAMVVFAFVHAVVTASYEASCLRWMIRGETSGFGGFSLGGDTWRIYGAYWIWFAISFACWVVVVLTVSLVVNSAGWVQGASGEVYSVYGAVTVWAFVISPLALRMSPGNAASVAKKKFAYFDSWKISSGRFRGLLGSFLIAWVIWALLTLALFIGGSFVIFTLLGDRTGMEEAVNRWMIVNMTFSASCVNVVLAFLSAGINARAALAAIEEGKLEGVGVSTNVAAVFD